MSGGKIPSLWHPIETAPKDGRYVIVWPPTWNGVTSCAYWHANKQSKNPKPFWYRVDAHGSVNTSRDNQPTHWMPILEGPK